MLIFKSRSITVHKMGRCHSNNYNYNLTKSHFFPVYKKIILLQLKSTKLSKYQHVPKLFLSHCDQKIF